MSTDREEGEAMSADEVAREVAIDVLKAHVDGENYALWHVLETLGRALLERDATIAAWTETARQYANAVELYRGLLDQCAAHLGREAWTSDDGSVQEDPVRLKIPELVGAERAAREKAERERDEARGVLADVMAETTTYPGGKIVAEHFARVVGERNAARETSEAIAQSHEQCAEQRDALLAAAQELIASHAVNAGLGSPTSQGTVTREAAAWLALGAAIAQAEAREP